MGGKSSSSASTSTTTVDAKVAADGEGVAIGSEANVTINNSFDDNVAAVANELIGLARDAGGAAVNAIDVIRESNSAQLEVLNRTQESESESTIKNLAPFVVAGLAIVFVLPKVLK